MKQPSWIFLLATLLVSVESQVDPETIAYYGNLINQNVAESYVYELPTDASSYEPNSPLIEGYGTFDHIIIGSGSAGSVIASRLSENKNKRVLLIEAGGHETNFTDIPGMAFYTLGLEFNWNYNTTPQKNACLGLTNKECPYPRGLALGGSTVVNALMYVRGNKLDYDDWCNQGNPGWCYEDVLPFFKLSENSQIPNADPGYHGTGGKLNVEYNPDTSPQLSAFLEANQELGLKILDDYNGEEQLGASRIQFNSLNGRRLSVAEAYLTPAENRDNLHVLTRAFAIKILIERISKTAYGVIFSRNKRLYVAFARKEVISSGGVFGSPQLLMLSGIGHPQHLLRHGILPVKSLAVGDNLQDHQAYFGLNFISNYTEPVESIVEYIVQFLNGRGIFTRFGNLQGLGFYQTALETRPGYPDIELLLVPSNSTTSYIQRAFHFTDETYAATWGNVDPTRVFAIYVILLHPKSVGNVRLKSGDAYDYPLIDPKFLSDKHGEDIKRLRLGIRFAIDLVQNTEAFKKIDAKLIEQPLPACQHLDYGSDDFWDCQLRQLTFNDFHPIGTCKMGPDPSKGAVVDHELKVHGVRNLRVADASVIPKATSGHTSAPAIMIGEKLAHMIKNGH